MTLLEERSLKWAEKEWQKECIKSPTGKHEHSDNTPDNVWCCKHCGLEIYIKSHKKKFGRKMVFVEGPFVANEERNVREAILTGDELFKAGFLPVVAKNCFVWNTIFLKSESFWEEYNEAMILRADCMLRLRGISRRAEREVDFCNRHDI